MEQAILATREDGVLILTINRPLQANAINGEVSTGLAEQLSAAASDSSVKVVIVTGAGDRFFSAGADVDAMTAGEDVLPSPPFDDWGLGGVARTVPQPVIAAVNGIAFGGGFEIALNSDFIIAEEHARFACPEIKVGIFPGAGGVFRLQDALPRPVALDMLMTGRSMDAGEALAHGLLHAVVPKGQSLESAIALARTLCVRPPLGLRAIKQLFYGIDAAGRPVRTRDLWAENNRLRDSTLASNDAREGFQAFLEKRSPVWTGT